MSEISKHESGSSSPRLKTATVATTCEDTMSITSSRIQPPVPHPTPAHTVAGDVPSNDFIDKTLQRLDICAEATIRAIQVSGLQRVESNQAEMCEEYPEASKWDGVAEEDVTRGLQRLSVLAEDEHKEDPSRSVEHYYSARLAKIISAGAIRFDAAYLET